MSIRGRRHGGRAAGVFRLTASPTAPGETITLTRMTVNKPTPIYWGDGTSQTLVANSTAAVTHVYAAAGSYPIVVANSRSITVVYLDSVKIGGMNTADLRYSPIDYFRATLITGSTIRSSDMSGWRPTYWHLYSMPAGTYAIDSAHMTNWRPAYWCLSSMPAGTYAIDSAHMTNWTITGYWLLYSMPAGTYAIDSAHMTNWRPSIWQLYSMPAANSSYTFTALCMRAWTTLATLRADGLGLDAATVDLILADIYAGRMGYTIVTPTLNLAGTNADPGGIYQAKVPPTTGMETKYELINDSADQGFHLWAITT